jgi:hypothetical protein
VNQEYAELIGHVSPEACIGKTDFEMASPIIECAQYQLSIVINGDR